MDEVPLYTGLANPKPSTLYRIFLRMGTIFPTPHQMDLQPYTSRSRRPHGGVRPVHQSQFSSGNELQSLI